MNNCIFKKEKRGQHSWRITLYIIIIIISISISTENAYLRQISYNRQPTYTYTHYRRVWLHIFGQTVRITFSTKALNPHVDYASTRRVLISNNYNTTCYLVLWWGPRGYRQSMSFAILIIVYRFRVWYILRCSDSETAYTHKSSWNSVYILLYL